MEVKELIHTISPDELRANVQVCLEHSCAIFLGNYQGLSKKEEEYVKECLHLEGEPNQSDLEFKSILEVFQTKMNATQSLWHRIGLVQNHKALQPLPSLLLGILQAFELSEVPQSIPPIMEALVTGQWKNFVLTAVGLMSPSGIKLEVIGQIIMYLIKEDFLGWCKRYIVCDSNAESFNLYANQTMEPLEKLLGEAPET
jgi:hypothetical protein